MRKLLILLCAMCAIHQTLADTYNITLNNVNPLPSGYTQLEYLESTGTQCIDTGITPTSDMKWVLDNEFTQAPTSNHSFFNGLWDPGLSMRFRIDLALAGLRFNYGPMNLVTNSPTPFINQRMTYVLDAQNMKWAYGDTKGDLPNYTQQGTATRTIHLFGGITTNGKEGLSYQKTYSSKIYRNGTLVQNLVPAKRDSDNVLGMYDTVNNVFKTNVCSGTFTAGNPATGSTTSTYTVGVGATINEVPTRDGYTFAGWCTDSALTNCAMTQTIGTSDTGDKTFYAKWTKSTYDIYLENVSALPSGYTQLEYIAGDGSQYINTGYYPKTNTWVHTDIMGTGTGNRHWLNAYMYKGNSRSFGFNQYNGSNFNFLYGDISAWTNVPQSNVIGTKFSVDFGKNSKIYIDDVEKVDLSSYTRSNETSQPLLLFARPGFESSSYMMIGRMYDFVIYEGDNIVHNYIPARQDSNNAVGLYDTVTNTFKTSSTSSAFTAGNPASTTSTYTVGVGATINEVPTRDGYTFAGWCTDSALTNCAMTQTIGTSDTGDKTFYAKWVENAGTTINCPAGEYLPMNANSCATCTANSYCGGGDYTPSDSTDQGIVSCSTGLFAPAGMWEAAQCGRILHVGDGFVYLRATKKTSPSLHLDLDHDGVADYFGNMTTFDVPMSSGTQRKLKVRYNNTTYSIYDDSVEIPTE